MASPISSPAPPLHVQHLEKALRLEPFFGFVEGIFSDPFLGSLSDSDNSGLSDLEKDFNPKDREGLVNGDGCNNLSTNGFLQPEELRIDKTRLYNFSKVKRERRWLKEVLLSDSSESSDEDEPLGDDDLQQMLWCHQQQKRAQERYYQDTDLLRYQHYSTGLLHSQDKYHELQKQMGSSKKIKKKMKDGKMKLVKVKKERAKIKRRKKPDDQIDEQKRLTLEERVIKKTLIRRKEADAKRRKIWSILCRKEIPRAQRQKSSAKNNMLSNAKKLAQLCQKERRREAQRSQRISQQTAPRARRLSREMLAYWKKYEKVEKEHRKRAEKEAMEQRKMDDELREARRQQRKLNFLITQTELYAHFMSKKLKNAKNSNTEVVQNILKKLDEPSSSHMVKTVQGGVVYDTENMDNYDPKAMKLEALANAHNAMKEQEAWTQAFDSSIQDHGNKKVTLSQESFDENFSLAKPNLTIDHPQPELFQGILKTYQLKGMNWLITLYEQGINGILADEMGLGKTVQSLAFLTYLAEVHNIWGPFLVVAPASTLHNWQQEAARFVPTFKVLPYWGNQGDRKSLRKYWSQKQGHISDRDHAPFHLLITSYQLVVQDVRYFQQIKWQYIILDEAQAIKSSSSVRWKILLGYQCRNRLLLTGTPIQNSMAELWALLHFIMPTLFDSHEEFNEWFSKDIESHAENKSIIDQNQLSRLHMILKPFMLRRIKRDVENELSEKIEIKLVCGLTTRQKWLYQAVRSKISIDDLVYTSASSSSAASATTSSLMNLVMQFRKVCNHPELFERRDVYSPISSCRLASYLIPKLVYREGYVERMFPSCTKILHNTINLWTPNHIAESLHCQSQGNQQVPASSCFSFLRFINVSAEEAAAFMQKGLTYRILLLLILLREVIQLQHRRFWSMEKSTSKCLGRHSLLLWPSMDTSFPNIQTSSVLSSLVFTGYTKPILAHLTHRIHPILDEKDLSPKKTGPSKPHPTSPLKHSSSGPFSPTGHHSTGFAGHHHHHHKHHHHHHHRHHHRKSQSGYSPTDDHRGSVYVYPTEGDYIGLPMKYPQQRHLQPTDVPTLVMAYIPRIVAGNSLSYCSDRSAAYEIQDLVLGGSELKRNLLLYGDPEGCGLKKLETRLFPPPPGGLEGSRPPKGWSFVQIPRRSALITDSGKLTVLDALLTKLKIQGHRILIYSQMTRMIDILEEFMTYRKHKYMRLDGSSKISDRRDMVADFQSNSDFFVFLLSTRAGGLGINLTAADTVIFYDSDWNPTVDQQAMDRAHRLGQTRQVTVYRLVTKNTIEERILQRANEKSEIQKMVISGGHFKPDALKPKEVVSLLLDDEELESKFLQRQAEKKADEQRKRRERKRKKGIPAETDSPLIPDNQGTPPPKAKKGRKSKSSLFPPAPETAAVLSEVSSINGFGATDMDDISVMSLDEVSLASGDGSIQSMDVNQSNVATPSSVRPENDDSATLDDPSSETASPSTVEPTSKRGKVRVRGRGRTRGSSMRGRGTGPIRVGRGRGRGRGGSGALAASAAASAAAAAASAAAYAAYGFTFQGTPTVTPTPPPSRSSPVAFGGGTTLLPGNAISQPVPRYDMETGHNSSNASEQS